jgi:GNAT superfamily N-acetyltransferase
MDIRLTTPLPEDARGITTLLYKTWLATYPNEKLGITAEDIEETYKNEFSEKTINKRAEAYRTPSPKVKRMIAKDGDIVVGMIAMIRNVENNQLRTVYVLPKYQGKGIGTMLREAVKDFADPSKDIIVQVADYNNQAIKFYEKIGFVDTGKRWNDEQFKLKSGAQIPEMEMVIRKS